MLLPIESSIRIVNSLMNCITRDGLLSLPIGFISVIRTILVGLLSGRCFVAGYPKNRKYPTSVFNLAHFSVRLKKGQAGVTVSWYYRPEQVSIKAYFLSKSF